MRYVQSITRSAALGILLLTAVPCMAKQPKASRAETAQKSPSGMAGAIEQQLAVGEVAISIDVPADELQKLPETIRVRYKNKSSKRGYFEIPGPFRGHTDGPYRVPSIVIEIQQGERGSIRELEPLFLFAPPDAQQPARPSVAVLDPGSSVVAKYPLSSFCLIGHGIAPDSKVNVRTCYREGGTRTEMRAYIVSDWNNSTKSDPFKRTASEPLVLKLSKPDDAKFLELLESSQVK